MRHGHSFPGKPGCSTVPRSKVHSTDSTTGVQAAGGRVKPLDYLKSSPPQSKEQTTIPNLTPSWKLWWSQTKKSEQLDFSREYEFSDASFHSSSWASKRLSKAIDGLLAKTALTAVSARGRLGHEVRCYGELSKSEGRDHVSTKPRGLVTGNDYDTVGGKSQGERGLKELILFLIHGFVTDLTIIEEGQWKVNLPTYRNATRFPAGISCQSSRCSHATEAWGTNASEGPSVHFKKTLGSHPFIYLLGHILGTCKFKGQRWNPSQSCDLRHSRGNRGFSTLRRARIEPSSQQGWTWAATEAISDP